MGRFNSKKMQCCEKYLPPYFCFWMFQIIEQGWMSDKENPSKYQFYMIISFTTWPYVKKEYSALLVTSWIKCDQSHIQVLLLPDLQNQESTEAEPVWQGLLNCSKSQWELSSTNGENITQWWTVPWVASLQIHAATEEPRTTALPSSLSSFRVGFMIQQ